MYVRQREGQTHVQRQIDKQTQAHPSPQTHTYTHTLPLPPSLPFPLSRLGRARSLFVSTRATTCLLPPVARWVRTRLFPADRASVCAGGPTRATRPRRATFSSGARGRRSQRAVQRASGQHRCVLCVVCCVLCVVCCVLCVVCCVCALASSLV